MRSGVKSSLARLLRPAFRVLAPSIRDIRHMWAYLVLCSRVQHEVPSSVVVMGTPEIHGTGQIRCGRNLLLYPGLYWETQGHGTIEIGDDVVMSRGVHVVAHAGVRIGSGSMIGEYTSIRDANHVRNAQGGMRDGHHSAALITIGTQVWIGRGATILPGVSIGDNATVGANSVVTRNVPAGETVVGAPAAPIRSRRAALAVKSSYAAD